MAIETLGAVRLFVSSIERAYSFYRDVLEFDDIAYEPGEHGFAVFTMDQNGIMLVVEEINGEDAAVLVGRFAGLSFVTSDIEAEVAQLRAKGVTVIDKPEEQPWGGILANFADPDDNILTLVQYPDM
ncbi:VOC family protein [Aestuariispira ectoiniformans]|uniref:VOC family protein n=1 Tax=Aestuariispira ectoiniformans TaxID=2775080 RepID=UPI00223B1693|nr:VOC family protein [Aestuariispira ectoiniformans]